MILNGLVFFKELHWVWTDIEAHVCYFIFENFDD